MSRLSVSTPAPTMSRSCARNRAASSLNPGACIVPLASLFRNRSALPMRGVPARVHRHERAARQAAVMLLPRQQIVNRQRRVGVFRRARFDRHDGERREEPVDRQPIGGGAAGDEVHRRVHVGAGVLVERELVGEESVLRDRELRLDLNRLEGGKHRRLRRERVGQIVDVAKAFLEPQRLLLPRRQAATPPPRRRRCRAP